MSNRRYLWVLASWVALSCDSSSDSESDRDEVVNPSPSCTSDCSGENGEGGGTPSVPEGSNIGGSSGVGVSNGGGGTSDGGDGTSDGGDASGEPTGGGGMAEPTNTPPGSGGTSTTPDPDEPEPALEPSMEPAPEPNGGSGGMTPTTPDASSPEPAPEPDTPEPEPDSAEPPSSRFRAVPIGESDAGLGYWEYLPPNYGSEPAPLLVFTHGAAWQGEGTLETLQELLEVGPPNLIDTDAWPNDRPFIVLSPQNPRSGCFDAGDIDTFYRYAVETYDVDPQRIYHTGQSCGAIGAWNYLAANLDEFVTAAVLISGDGQAAFDQAGCDLGRVAIWGLHNEMDTSVDSQGTIGPINALLECEPTPDVKLTIYPGETEHDAWTKTYDLSAGNDVYAWLLEHVHP